MVIWVIYGYMLFYGLYGLFVIIIHNLIYIFLNVLSPIIFQTLISLFSRHQSLKEISI